MRGAIISAALLAVAVTSVPAMASGSGSRGGGGLGGGFGSGSVPTRLSEEDRLERRGKSQVRKRITCKKCEYHKRLNNQTAAEVARAVRNGRFELKESDRTAVLYYLRQRYGV